VVVVWFGLLGEGEREDDGVGEWWLGRRTRGPYPCVEIGVFLF
jgi:hypothetical protein